MPQKTSQKTSLKTTSSFSIGIDLGGTKVAAALVDAKGGIVSESVRPTVPPYLHGQDPRNTKTTSARDVREHIQYVIGSIADATIELFDSVPGSVAKNLAGIGLASAGPMNLGRGSLDYPSNFKGWKVVPLVELLSEALEQRGLKLRKGHGIFFQNDAMAAALGEGWVGSAKGCKTFAVVTVGTGIGTGVIFNGQPAQSTGMGSEWGHMLVNCAGLTDDGEDLEFRTVEGHASGTWLIRRAQARGFRGANAADLAEAAKMGDKIAKEAFLGASEALAALLFSLSLGFHPEKFVVSGGMLAIKEMFLPQTIELYRKLIKQKGPQFLAPVQVAKLGIKSGVIGAARLPWL